MPHLSYERRQLTFKLVYTGPGMSGKTTNLVFLYRSLSGERKGELLTLDTAEERTLFFDFFPLEIGEIDGYSLHFNLYTVPGQVYYEASRRLILDGADGVVFVADSQPDRLDENLESFQRLEENLSSYGHDPRAFPRVLQYNKRDCESPLPRGCIETRLGLGSTLPVFDAVATEGAGVVETIHALCRQVIEDFRL